MFIRLSRTAYIGPFVLAFLVGVIACSLLQSQVNLMAVAEMGAQISPAERVATFWHDLIHFTPFFTVLFLPAFLISQLTALWLSKRLRAFPASLLFVLASVLGLWLSIQVLDMVAPTEGVLYASLSGLGTLLLLLGAAAAGLCFERLMTGKAKRLGIGSFAFASLLLMVPLSAPSPSWAATGEYELIPVVQGLDKPWSLAFLPDGRTLVTEKPGRLRVVSAEGQLESRSVSGVPEVYYGGQGGLLEVLPAPDFTQSRTLYLSYSCGTYSANSTCVAKGQLNGFELTSVQEIFRSKFAKRGGAHFGGRMVWLPDNTLVLTLGDGYSYRNEAQSTENHLGTLVRLNPDGSVPADNPFVNQPDSEPEIYSYGHRNVQGLFYDPDTGRLFEHEHGARGGDEINLIQPGSNYGWPLATYGIDYSGAQISPYTEYEGTAQPLLYWVPSIAPSGMTLYKGDLFPQWRGHLLVGALAGQHVRLVKLEGSRVTGQVELFRELGERIRDVRSGPDGAVYLLTDGSDAQLIRVAPAQ